MSFPESRYLSFHACIVKNIILRPSNDHEYCANGTAEKSYRKFTSFVSRDGLCYPTQVIFDLVRSTKQFYQYYINQAQGHRNLSKKNDDGCFQDIFFPTTSLRSCSCNYENWFIGRPSRNENNIILRVGVLQHKNAHREQRYSLQKYNCRSFKSS